jgi:hypothetical protein
LCYPKLRKNVGAFVGTWHNSLKKHQQISLKFPSVKDYAALLKAPTAPKKYGGASGGAGLASKHCGAGWLDCFPPSEPKISKKVGKVGK